MGRIITPDDISGQYLRKFLDGFKKTKGCWEWSKTKQSGKHGQVCVRGKTIGTHRVSWLVHRGSIPRGMFVCHKCDNPPCVNPDHLFLGTHRDNVMDRLKKNHFRRAYRAWKTKQLSFSFANGPPNQD